MTDIADRWLYHFTHIDNLAGIAAEGMVADGMAPATVVECAEPSIKQRRRELTVPIGDGGVVADYVPFYFAPRSPMLYRIHRGGVGSYQRGQDELVYLVSRVSRVEALGRRWVATDRNAAVEPGRFIDDAASLSTHVDWEIMAAEQWADTVEDGSRKQRRMAEFLVHHRVPWEAFTHVAACSEAAAAAVNGLIQGRSHTPRVVVRPGWYF